MASTSPRRERECSSVHLCSRRLPAAIPVSCEDIDIVNDITQYLEFASDSPDFVTVLGTPLWLAPGLVNASGKLRQKW